MEAKFVFKVEGIFRSMRTLSQKGLAYAAAVDIVAFKK